MNKPVFTITGKETGKVYKIYLNGNVEGFDEDVSIFNQIPICMREECEVREEMVFHELINRISKFIESYPHFKTDMFYSINEARSKYSSEEHTWLSKPNFSIRTVSNSKDKDDK